MANCRDEALAIACFTNAAGAPSSVFANHVYNADGSLHALYYTDTAGAIVDTSAGTVTAGACPIAQPDVEWEQLCDVQSDGTVVQFMCRSITRFNADGSVIDPVEVSLFEMDKVTAYVVTGDVGDCDSCPVEPALGLITDLSQL